MSVMSEGDGWFKQRLPNCPLETQKFIVHLPGGHSELALIFAN